MVTANERRNQILEYLSINRFSTYRNLSEQFNVSKNTIVNDITILTISAPIFTVSGKGGGIRVADGWYISKVYLSEKQETLLNNLLPSLSGTDEKTMKEILAKFSIPKV